MKKRIMITMVLDNNYKAIVKCYDNPKQFLAATLVYAQDKKENKIKDFYTYDSNDDDDHPQQYQTNINQNPYQYTSTSTNNTYSKLTWVYQNESK